MNKSINTVSSASERELVREYSRGRRFPVLFPWCLLHKIWWGLTVVAALFGMFLETYLLAFSPGGWSKNSAALEIIIILIFALDIIVNFNMAYYDDSGKIVFARVLIAKNYMKRMFWVDLVGVIPFYYIAMKISGQIGQSNSLTQNLALLRLLTLVRLHRVPVFFSIMKYSNKISLMSLTLIRDLSAVLTWTHLWACIMFFIAGELSINPDEITWLGLNVDIISLAPFEQYVTSLYWSVVTFTTVGYGDFSPVHPIEQIFGVVYMILNVVLMAWVIGSITLLIVKNDEKTGLYRETMHVLHKYAALHNFDKDLTKKLKNQLRLDFENREVSDEQVLQFFPAGVRRRVLRRLYLETLINTDLMRGTRNQFVDAFLSLCKVEVFSPGDELLQRGAVSSELYLVLDGSLEVVSSGNVDTSLSTRDGDFVASVWSMADSTEMGSVSGRKRLIPKGEFVNEIGFFTESAQMDTIRTRSVCKILSMAKADWKQLSAEYPGSACRVLANLLSKVQAIPKKSVMHTSSYLDGETEADIAQAEVHVEHTRVVVEDLIKMHINKQKDDHTTCFCFAASRGDTATIAALCDQGFDPNSSDYDKRTALMVASMKGNVDVVAKLLEYHCDPNLQDVHGTTALMEAVKYNHEDVCSILLASGAHLSLCESQAASTLCQAVFDGDIMLLRRLLKANIQVNAGDYDKRTAAHIAAAESNHLALQVLVEHGADLSLKDRWGSTPADEAKRVNAVKILDYLRSLEHE